MSHYADLIRESVAVTRPDRADAATVALIEECMRTERTALDAISRADFVAEARQWAETIDSDFARMFADALQIPTPAWAAITGCATQPNKRG